MNRVSIALVALSIAASQLMAQRANSWGGYPNTYEPGPALAWTNVSGENPAVRQNLDGGVCFPAPYYQYCSYDYNNYYAMELYRLRSFFTIWSGMHGSAPSQPSYTIQLAQAPPPAPPPVTAVVHEYHWPEQTNRPAAPATFSIVTTSGTVYLATMVWVEDGNLHFTSVDGSVGQIPLSSISRSLTQTANAAKNLKLPVQLTEAASPNVEAPPATR